MRKMQADSRKLIRFSVYLAILVFTVGVDQLLQGGLPLIDSHLMPGTQLHDTCIVLSDLLKQGEQGLPLHQFFQDETSSPTSGHEPVDKAGQPDRSRESPCRDLKPSRDSSAERNSSREDCTETTAVT